MGAGGLTERVEARVEVGWGWEVVVEVEGVWEGRGWGGGEELTGTLGAMLYRLVWLALSVGSHSLAALQWLRLIDVGACLVRAARNSEIVDLAGQMEGAGRCFVCIIGVNNDGRAFSYLWGGHGYGCGLGISRRGAFGVLFFHTLCGVYIDSTSVLSPFCIVSGFCGFYSFCYRQSVMRPDLEIYSTERFFVLFLLC